MTPHRSHGFLYRVLGPAVLVAAVAIGIRLTRPTPPEARSVTADWKSLTTDNERWQAVTAWVDRGVAAVPELIVVLSSDDWTLRRFAATALSRIGPPARSAIPALIRLLDDHNQTHFEVVMALKDIGCDDPSAIPGLVRLMNDARHVYLRPTIVELLSSHGPAVIPAALSWMKADKHNLHRPSIDLSNSVMEPTAQGEDTRDLHRFGIDLLQRVGIRTHDVVAALRRLLRDDDLRQDAASTLLDLHALGPDDVRLLLEKGNASYNGLFQLEHPGELVSVMQRVLEERGEHSPGVLSALAYTAQVASEWSVLAPSIRPYLRDESPHVRWDAVTALGKLDVDREEFVPVLRDLVLRDVALAPTAAGILKEIAPDEACELVAILREQIHSSNLGEQLIAIDILSAFGEPARAALPDLREALANPRLRDSTIQALASLGPVAESLVPDLLALMDEGQFGLFVPQDFDRICGVVTVALVQIAPGRTDVQKLLFQLPVNPGVYQATSHHGVRELRLIGPSEMIGLLGQFGEPTAELLAHLEGLRKASHSGTQREIQQALAKVELRSRLRSAVVAQFAHTAGSSDGPTWRDGELCFGSEGLLRVTRAGEVQKFLDISPAGTFPRPDGHLLLCDNQHKALLALAPDGRVGVLAEEWNGEPLRSLNDVTQDHDGNIYWTDPDGSSKDNPVGRVFRLRPDGRVDCVADDLAFPNGVEVDPRNQFLYVIDSQTHRVLRCRLESFEEAPHPVAHRFHPVFDLGGSGADGCAFDADGRLWVADVHRPETKQGQIVVLDIQDSRIQHKTVRLGQLDIPAEVVSNITFGGTNNDELFCTTGNPHGVFHAQVGTKGFRGHAGRPLNARRFLDIQPAAN